MKTIKLTKENLKKAIRETVLALKAGEVLEVPTDTVSGLICDYYNKSAEKEIFRLKKRPEEKILPIFISSISEVKKLVPVNRRQEKFMEKVWPGKVTCVLKKDVGGFRIPGDKFILKLLQKYHLNYQALFAVKLELAMVFLLWVITINWAILEKSFNR